MFPAIESQNASSWKGPLNIISSNPCPMLKTKATGILSYQEMCVLEMLLGDFFVHNTTLSFLLSFIPLLSVEMY